MHHFSCLHVIGKFTYYIGWIALLCGGLIHFNINIATKFFLAMCLSQRNLLEVCVVSFLICIASELLARNAVCKETPSATKNAA